MVGSGFVLRHQPVHPGQHFGIHTSLVRLLINGALWELSAAEFKRRRGLRSVLRPLRLRSLRQPTASDSVGDETRFADGLGEGKELDRVTQPVPRRRGPRAADRAVIGRGADLHGLSLGRLP
jgi:hypothetical protein